MAGIAEKKNPLGPVGRVAASNIRRLRQEQNLTYAELSRRLDELGRPIATLGLSRIESEARRIDIDDLVGLAVALGVSPVTLLMPNIKTPTEWHKPVTVTCDDRTFRPEVVWEWYTAQAPLAERPTGREVDAFHLKAVPPEAYMLEQLGFGAEGRRQRNGDD
ncbi:helix-turn-helix domain-containing protein [Rhodococcus pyridinivorans]|uniref:helix-turn-helix domain-containing protein n=1 Tax=Rhodococcus pyridinivorans TaxID=103816 RepID=UPI00369BAFEC